MAGRPVNFRSVGWVDQLCGWIAPWRCQLCAEPGCGMDLCLECLQDLPWLARPCPGCALPLPRSGACPECARHAPSYSHTCAALLYEYPVSSLLTALKYQQRPHLARLLAELLAVAVLEQQRCGPMHWPGLLLPVPLHPRRQRQRGYNQAELLAHWLAEAVQVPVAPTRTLIRCRDTPPQVQLDRQQRRANLNNAFAVRRSLDGMAVAVVDDVMTTGATVEAVAAALRAAGAADVQLWVVARARV